MQGALKVANSQAPKANVSSSLSSLKVSEKTDDFIKLLQAKKEAAPESGETKQVNDPKGTKTETDPKAEAKGEKPEPSGEENPEEEASTKEALQQAALQQTAAMMAIVLSQPEEAQPVTLPETAGQPAEAVTAVQEAVPGDSEPVFQASAITEESAKVPQEAQPAAAEAAPNLRSEAAAEKPAQTKTETVQESISRPAEQVTQPEQSEAYQSPFGSQEKETRADSQDPSRRTGANETGETSQAAAGAETMKLFGQQTQDHFMTQKTEMPLKTTPETLPQDLGKTLAGNILKEGQTLTVELEPASLGKLTIRLIYEGDRAAVSIMANNPKTLELLSQKASEIASILEEKTGQETLIYTQQPQQNQEGYDREPDGKQQAEENSRQHQEKKEDQHQADSFAQQLRLGLI